MKKRLIIILLLGFTLSLLAELLLAELLLAELLLAEEFTSFNQFQNHIKKESIRVLDADEHARIRAERDDRDYVIGDVKTFWRWDFTNMPPAWEQAQATCKAVGEYCYVFICDDQWNINMNQDDVDIVFNYLENETIAGDDFGAVQMDIDLFGPVPDELDNDPKIIVYYSALGSYNGISFDGYFSAYNQITEAEAGTMNPPGHSNECEMIYMTCSPLDPTEPIRISVLSHELQHMIHWGGDINELTWVDEGMAELAMVYFGMPDPISGFNTNANITLNTWDQQWADYIKVLLFFTYLDERFPSEGLIADIVSEPLNGIQGIMNQLTEHGYTIPFEAIFTNWTIANYLDEENIYDGIYNYESLTLPNFHQSYFHNNYPVDVVSTVNPWATRYTKFTHDTPVTLNINVSNDISLGLLSVGTDVASVVEIVPVSGDNTILIPALEEGYNYHILVVANNNNQLLNFSYDIAEAVGADDEEIEATTSLNLSNYPNPFNPATVISFQLPENSGQKDITLEIYNLKGQKIKTLPVILSFIRQGGLSKDKGKHSVAWNGTDDNNNSVSSGIYYYKVTAGSYSEMNKMLLMK